jgi:Ca2+-transporting ATPase
MTARLEDLEGMNQSPPGGAALLGLSSAEVTARQRQYGPNQLVPERRRSRWRRWLRPLTDPMALLLLIAAPTYLVIGDVADAVVTFCALIPIAAVTWVLEARAERTLERLRQLTTPTVPVWRDEAWRHVSSGELVPGDLIMIREGDVVPADGEMRDGSQLLMDEAALTGESQPVAKATDEMGDGAVLAGTKVLSGRGYVELSAIGASTRYGQIGELVSQVVQPPSPLQTTVRRLVVQLGIVAAVFCAAMLVVELARGRGWGAAIIASVSLAIAAVPEEFPMVYTLYLALGAWRLAKDNVMIRRLPGVETLGSTSVICSDKTGTMTLGQLEVGALAGTDAVITETQSAAATHLLEAAVLASEPDPFDPLEAAIVARATSSGIDVDRLHNEADLVHDYAFDPVDKYLAHVWRRGGDHVIAAKGSLEGVLSVVGADAATAENAQRLNVELASTGMRVIAVAFGVLDRVTGDRTEDERSLRFVGLIAFRDPLRPGVTEALAECRAAGIRVIMITGDHPLTAHAVAEGLDLPHQYDEEDLIVTGDELDAADEPTFDALVLRANVFARTRPEQKHRLVQALRANGDIVAMTGDGINDAPALREADIGIAMGQRGTEVAREAATMVLVDDNFATIVAAVRDGRRIFENLRRAFGYLVAFHPPLLLAALVVPIVGRPLLLLPVHLVLLELIVHPVVSLVFENDPAADDVMRRPPLPRGRGLVNRNLLRPLVLGVTLAIAVIIVYMVQLAGDGPEDLARSWAFATMLVGQGFLVLVARSPDRPAWRSPLRTNRTLLPALATLAAITLLIVYVPPLANLLKLAPLSLVAWPVIIAIAAASTLWSELFVGRAKEGTRPEARSR